MVLLVSCIVVLLRYNTLMWEKKFYHRNTPLFDDAIVPKTSILSVADTFSGVKRWKIKF